MSHKFTGLPENWDEAPREKLFEACCMSQRIVGEDLEKLKAIYLAMREIHAAAARRGMRVPDLLTDADKVSLTFVTQKPLQN